MNISVSRVLRIATPLTIPSLGAAREPDMDDETSIDSPAAPPAARTPTAATTGPAAAAVGPLPSMTFDQLVRRIRKHDAEEAQIRAILLDRLLALGGAAVDVGMAETTGSRRRTPTRREQDEDR